MFRPEQCSEPIAEVIREVARAYQMPTWFLFSICQRESSFQPALVNTTDGSAGTHWEGSGLTQLTGPVHVGMPYPNDLSSPDNRFSQWRFDQGLNHNPPGAWVDMAQVSRLDDKFDPVQNLTRFLTVHAIPSYYLAKRRYPNLNSADCLRVVAFWWNHGVVGRNGFRSYDPLESDYPLKQKYLTGAWGYDHWLQEFLSECEASDGVWPGTPILVPQD